VQYNRFAAEREQPFWTCALVESGRAARRGGPRLCDGRLTAGPPRDARRQAHPRDRQPPPVIAAAPAQPAEGLEFALGDLAAWESPHPSMWPSPTRRCNGCPTTAPCSPAGPSRLRPAANWPSRCRQRRHPAHTVRAELAADCSREPPQTRWPRTCSRLRLRGRARRARVRRPDVRLQVYVHHLRSTREVVEWVKAPPSPASRNRSSGGLDRFVDLYRTRLLGVLATAAVPLPFKRIAALGQVLLTRTADLTKLFRVLSSRARPRNRSAMMLRWTSDVPAPDGDAGEKR